MKDLTSVGCLVFVACRVASVRKRWKQALAPDFPTIEVANRLQLEQKVSRLSPSILFVDEELLGSGTRKSLPTLQRLSSATRIVVLASQPDETVELSALQSGACGYCNRDLAPVLIKRLVQMVQKGELWFTRGIIRHLLRRPVNSEDRFHAHKRFSLKDVKGLTDRQREIALGIASGASNKKIADDLSITESTVKAHLSTIFRKLGVSDRLTLALLVRDKTLTNTAISSVSDPTNGNGHF